MKSGQVVAGPKTKTHTMSRTYPARNTTIPVVKLSNIFLSLLHLLLIIHVQIWFLRSPEDGIMINESFVNKSAIWRIRTRRPWNGG